MGDMQSELDVALVEIGATSARVFGDVLGGLSNLSEDIGEVRRRCESAAINARRPLSVKNDQEKTSMQKMHNAMGDQEGKGK